MTWSPKLSVVGDIVGLRADTQTDDASSCLTVCQVQRERLGEPCGVILRVWHAEVESRGTRRPDDYLLRAAAAAAFKVMRPAIWAAWPSASLFGANSTRLKPTSFPLSAAPCTISTTSQ